MLLFPSSVSKVACSSQFKKMHIHYFAMPFPHSFYNSYTLYLYLTVQLVVLEFYEAIVDEA